MFRKLALLALLTIIAGCETFSGAKRDLTNLVDMVSESDILAMPTDEATKAPKALPSYIDARTGIIIDKEKAEYDKKQRTQKKSQSSKKASKKPLSTYKKRAAAKKTKKNTRKTARKSHKKVKKKTVTHRKKMHAKSHKQNKQSVDTALCNPLLLSQLKDISGLYHFYYKKPKDCTAHHYQSKATDVLSLVLTQRHHQDVRLLNADHGFATFISKIIHYAPSNVRHNAASLLRTTGCGLISQSKCKVIIK